MSFKEISLVRRFASTIRESNRQSRDAWGMYSEHRERVTRILTAAGQHPASLCILGPGNLNDVALERVLEQYAEVHLVDLDVAAVHAGVERSSAGAATVTVHGPIDLTGILHRLAAAGEDADPAGLIEALECDRCAVPGAPFGVTASTGLLTQLLQSVVESSLSQHDVAAISLAVRDKHLADLVHLTCSGGTLVLVSDIVSSTTAPQLLTSGQDELERHMAELVAAGNFFTGTNPYRIAGLLEGDARFRGLVQDVRLLEPWLWHVTRDRQHLTYAIVARRA